MVYSGPAAEAVNHFQENGFECPPYSNPSDYFMRVCDHTQRERERDAQGESRGRRGHRCRRIPSVAVCPMLTSSWRRLRC